MYANIMDYTLQYNTGIHRYPIAYCYVDCGFLMAPALQFYYYDAICAWILLIKGNKEAILEICVTK